jgi:NTE family protein
MNTTQQAPDPAKIGISYSGGGPLLAIELGIARAFVKMGIKPAVIAGASAGAIAASAHALDVDSGRGIDLAVDQLGHMTNATLKLDPFDFVARVVAERMQLRAVGDNTPAADMVANVVQQVAGVKNLTLGAFGQPIVTGGPTTPQVQVVATDVVAEEAYWFGPAAPLTDALVASSAIPGIFPWVSYTEPGGAVRTLVDGGVVENQPLQKLVDLGCGRIYACAVGGTPVGTPPQNLIENVLRSINLSMHACSKIEEAFLRSTLPANCRVIHIHPEVSITLVDFNFTPDLATRAVDEACDLTVKWLQGDPQT